METTEQTRLSPTEFQKLAPKILGALYAVHQAIVASGLDQTLAELCTLRASQLNGCAFCVQMHASALRKFGNSEERLQLVAVWRDAPVFSAKEKAALAYTEAVTQITPAGIPDALFNDLKSHCTDSEFINLATAIAMINLWNRLAIPFRYAPQVAEPKA